MNKVTKKIKIIWLNLLLLAGLPLTILAQVSYDLSGVFEGKHVEFSVDGANDSMVYLYKFELTQTGNQVNGKSFIYNDDGYYAVVRVKGLIVEDEFYFEEYTTLDEINPKENRWCYNSGHLDIVVDESGILLEGLTKSYTKQYGAFCRVGHSSVFKMHEDDINFNEDIDEDFEVINNLVVSPNPTRSEASISFSLLDERMTIIEVRDLEGELILEAVNRDLSPGNYTFPIDLSFKPDGMYIVELIVDRKLHSTELWKGKF